MQDSKAHGPVRSTTECPGSLSKEINYCCFNEIDDEAGIGAFLRVAHSAPFYANWECMCILVHAI